MHSVSSRLQPGHSFTALSVSIPQLNYGRSIALWGHRLTNLHSFHVSDSERAESCRHNYILDTHCVLALQLSRLQFRVILSEAHRSTMAPPPEAGATAAAEPSKPLNELFSSLPTTIFEVMSKLGGYLMRGLTRKRRAGRRVWRKASLQQL